MSKKHPRRRYQTQKTTLKEDVIYEELINIRPTMEQKSNKIPGGGGNHCVFLIRSI